MQSVAISRIVSVAIRAMIVCSLLAAASAALANDRDTTCSDRTLQGDYASAIDGLILPGPGVTVPISGVNIVHYDGKGNSTQVWQPDKRLDSRHRHLSCQC